MSEKIKRPPEELIIAERLKGQWHRVVQSVGGNTVLIESEFSKMSREYQSGEGRAYHNLSHIGKVDTMINRYGHLARDFVALKFAGDGHDVIYVPGSETNEADSAEYMSKTMKKLGIPQPTISETERLILISKEHKTTDDDIDGKLLIDADFSIFASPEPEYDEYAQSIWQEYVGSGKVSEEAFRKGRDDLLKTWLEQDRIFLVDEIRNQLESKARQNLERERMHLSA